MFQDEEMFPNPRKFIPERFLEEELAVAGASRWRYRGKAVDPRVAVFGYGRRYV
jgi:cytochrome P450